MIKIPNFQPKFKDQPISWSMKNNPRFMLQESNKVRRSPNSSDKTNWQIILEISSANQKLSYKNIVKLLQPWSLNQRQKIEELSNLKIYIPNREIKCRKSPNSMKKK